MRVYNEGGNGDSSGCGKRGGGFGDGGGVNLQLANWMQSDPTHCLFIPSPFGQTQSPKTISLFNLAFLNETEKARHKTRNTYITEICFIDSWRGPFDLNWTPKVVRKL